MLVPNQIKNTTFPLAGRGAYRAQDVDEFQKRVYAAYSELYSENSVLKKKFASLTALVEEYNEGKNSIANAIIKSQAISDKMIEEAKKQAADLITQAKLKAEEILSESKKKADEYASEKTSTADAYLTRAETELDRVKKQAEASASDYIQKVNEKAEQIISNANEQASKIVAAAYADAKKASEKCDEIIMEARSELDTIKREIAVFKAQTEKMISVVVPALDAIQIPDSINIETADDVESASETVFEGAEVFERFEFKPEQEDTQDITDAEKYGDEEVIEVKDEDASIDEYEDISSDSGSLDSYFSSFIEDIKSSGSESDGNNDEEQNNAVSSDDETSDSDRKGYNGNNTSFKPSSGFVVTDFDDEDEED